MDFKHPLTKMAIPLGVIPQLLMRDDEEDKRRRGGPAKKKTVIEAAMAGTPIGMKKGGKVRSIDGCAVRGKTRGTMK